MLGFKDVSILLKARYSCIYVHNFLSVVQIQLFCLSMKSESGSVLQSEHKHKMRLNNLSTIK